MSILKENPRNPNPGDVNLGQPFTGYWLCHKCGKPHHFRRGKCIQCLLDAVPWKEGEQVRVKSNGRIGIAAYRYYNGYTLVKFPNTPVKGGSFNNDSSYKNDELERVAA